VQNNFSVVKLLDSLMLDVLLANVGEEQSLALPALKLDKRLADLTLEKVGA